MLISSGELSSVLSSLLCVQADPFLNLRSKEQEAELVTQTLAALTAMRIRFPGKSEEEAESVLDEVSLIVALKLLPWATIFQVWKQNINMTFEMF